MKHLFALIAVCGMTASLAGCAGGEPADVPDTTPELGVPADLSEPPMIDEPVLDDSGSTTGADGPTIP